MQLQSDQCHLPMKLFFFLIWCLRCQNFSAFRNRIAFNGSGKWADWYIHNKFSVHEVSILPYSFTPIHMVLYVLKIFCLSFFTSWCSISGSAVHGSVKIGPYDASAWGICKLSVSPWADQKLISLAGELQFPFCWFYSSVYKSSICSSYYFTTFGIWQYGSQF